MANTILLKGRGVRDERVAGGTITPGDLVILNSSGQLIRNATAAIAVVPRFAVENDLVGKSITDDYVVNDYVQSEILRSGNEVYAFVAAAASAIVVGNRLEADASGGLRILASGVALAVALEAVDNSGGASRARIKVVLL